MPVRAVLRRESELAFHKSRERTSAELAREQL